MVKKVQKSCSKENKIRRYYSIFDLESVEIYKSSGNVFNPLCLLETSFYCINLGILLKCLIIGINPSNVPLWTPGKQIMGTRPLLRLSVRDETYLGTSRNFHDKWNQRVRY